MPLPEELELRYRREYERGNYPEAEHIHRWLQQLGQRPAGEPGPQTQLLAAMHPIPFLIDYGDLEDARARVEQMHWRAPSFRPQTQREWQWRLAVAETAERAANAVRRGDCAGAQEILAAACAGEPQDGWPQAEAGRRTLRAAAAQAFGADLGEAPEDYGTRLEAALAALEETLDWLPRGQRLAQALQVCLLEGVWPRFEAAVTQAIDEERYEAAAELAAQAQGRYATRSEAADWLKLLSPARIADFRQYLAAAEAAFGAHEFAQAEAWAESALGVFEHSRRALERRDQARERGRLQKQHRETITDLVQGYNRAMSAERYHEAMNRAAAILAQVQGAAANDLEQPARIADWRAVYDRALRMARRRWIWSGQVVSDTVTMAWRKSRWWLLLLLCLGLVVGFFAYRDELRAWLASAQSTVAAAFDKMEQARAAPAETATAAVRPTATAAEVVVSLATATDTPAPTAEPATETPTTPPTAAATATLPPAICDTPGVCIAAPRMGERLSGMVEIRGSADYANFVYYKIEYGQGDDPQTWYTMGDVVLAPVTDGALLSFDSHALANGSYWLRLIVVDRTGNFPPPSRVQVTVEN